MSSIESQSEVLSENLKTHSSPNFEETLYQFIKLYDSWSLEQRLVGKREAEMLKSVETFNLLVTKLEDLKSRHTQQIEALKVHIPQQVAKALGETTVKASEILSQEAKKLFEQEAFSEVKRMLTLYRGQGFWVRWKTIFLLTLGSAITGTVIGLYLIFEWSWPYGMYKKHYQFYYQRQEQQKVDEKQRTEIEKLKKELEAALKANEQKNQEVEKLKKFQPKQPVEDDGSWRR